MTDQTITVEARLSWFLLGAVVVLFVGALFWGMLDPHVTMMEHTGSNITNATTADSGTQQAYQTGWHRVTLTWELWPFWFAMGLMYAAFRRAINESKRAPGR